MILKSKASTHILWINLEKLFRDIKGAKIFQLDNEICNIGMVDSSVITNWTWDKTIIDLLENLDSPIPEKNLVMYTINRLSYKFNFIATLIRHTQATPSFSSTRSMLLVEEQHVALVLHVPHSHVDHSSSQMLMLFDASRGGFSKNRGGWWVF